MMNFIICYLFDTADCNGLNDHSLENKEQCHCRNHCNYGCCHDQSIITLNCIIGIEGTDNHLQCPVLFASQESFLPIPAYISLQSLRWISQY